MESQRKSKEEGAVRRKRAEELIIPLLIEKSENILDAITWTNTFSAKLQEMAAEKAVSMKVSEFEKDFRVNVTAKHGDRYNGLFDKIKDLEIKEAVTLLNEVKIITNEAIERKYSKTKLGEFIEKKSVFAPIVEATKSIIVPK